MSIFSLKSCLEIMSVLRKIAILVKFWWNYLYGDKTTHAFMTISAVGTLFNWGRPCWSFYAVDCAYFTGMALSVCGFSFSDSDSGCWGLMNASHRSLQAFCMNPSPFVKQGLTKVIVKMLTREWQQCILQNVPALCNIYVLAKGPYYFTPLRSVLEVWMDPRPAWTHVAWQSSRKFSPGKQRTIIRE